MHGAGLHPICLRSFKQSKPTFPPSSIAIWEGPIIPNRMKESLADLSKGLHNYKTKVTLCLTCIFNSHLITSYYFQQLPISRPAAWV